jgi:hypothetical protein
MNPMRIKGSVRRQNLMLGFTAVMNLSHRAGVALSFSLLITLVRTSAKSVTQITPPRILNTPRLAMP